MERLTEYVTENCSKPFYRFRSDGEIYIRYRYCLNIEKAIDKLAEYENTGLEPSEIEKLKYDLAVRDKALELAEQTIRMICPPIAIGGIVPEHFNDTKDSEYFIDQAEKELKGDEK